MAKYTTISEFKRNHPNEESAMQFVFISPAGEIHQYVMHIEAWHSEMKKLMTDYVFVNDWKVSVQTINVF